MCHLSSGHAVRKAARQEIARAVIRWSEDIAGRGNKMRLQRVPGHAEIEGNEVADRMAKEAAAGEFHGNSES